MAMKLSLFVSIVAVKGNFLGEADKKRLAKLHNEKQRALVMIGIYTADLKRFDGADTKRKLSNWRYRLASLDHQLKNIS